MQFPFQPKRAKDMTIGELNEFCLFFRVEYGLSNAAGYAIATERHGNWEKKLRSILQACGRWPWKTKEERASEEQARVLEDLMRWTTDAKHLALSRLQKSLPEALQALTSVHRCSTDLRECAALFGHAEYAKIAQTIRESFELAIQTGIARLPFAKGGLIPEGVEYVFLVD